MTKVATQYDILEDKQLFSKRVVSNSVNSVRSKGFPNILTYHNTNHLSLPNKYKKKPRQKRQQMTQLYATNTPQDDNNIHNKQGSDKEETKPINNPNDGKQ